LFAVYAWAWQYLQELSLDERRRAAQLAIQELYDEQLISFFWATRGSDYRRSVREARMSDEDARAVMSRVAGEWQPEQRGPDENAHMAVTEAGERSRYAARPTTEIAARAHH
jgi:hypothetical protein